MMNSNQRRKRRRKLIVKNSESQIVDSTNIQAEIDKLREEISEYKELSLYRLYVQSLRVRLAKLEIKLLEEREFLKTGYLTLDLQSICKVTD